MLKQLPHPASPAASHSSLGSPGASPAFLQNPCSERTTVRVFLAPMAAASFLFSTAADYWLLMHCSGSGASAGGDSFSRFLAFSRIVIDTLVSHRSCTTSPTTRSRQVHKSSATRKAGSGLKQAARTAGRLDVSVMASRTGGWFR